MIPNLSEINHDPSVFDFLKKLWVNNFSWMGFGHLAEQIFEEIETLATDEEIITKIDEILKDKDFKKASRKNFSIKKFKAFQFELIKPFLKNANNLLDYGCGKMALLRRIAKEEELSNIKVLAGFDPNVEIEYPDFDKRAVFTNKIADFYFPNDFRGATTEVRKSKSQLNKFDLIVSSYVFHHMTEKEIEKSIENIKKLLAQDGKFILIEESFGESLPNQKDKSFIEKTGFQINEERTKEFMEFDEEKRKKIVLLNDVLINYRNLSYIPWTNQYKKMEEWRNIFEKKGLKLQDEYFFGFIKEGRLKQGITSLQVYSETALSIDEV